MDWMPVRTNIWTDRRTLALTDVLASDHLPGCGTLTLDDVASKVLRAWAWARDTTANGKVLGATARTLDLVIRHDGFAIALAHRDVGWLEIHESTGPDDQPYLRFPEWDRWNSKGAKARLQNARRQANHRVTERVTERVTNRTEQNRTTENRREEQRTEEQTEQTLLSVPEGVQKKLCSLLLRLVERTGGKDYPIFDDAACAAIAADRRCSEMRIAWAVDQLKGLREPPRKKAAWLRSMILDDKKAPPPGWVAKYQRGQLAQLAANEKPTTNPHPAPPASGAAVGA